jgi:hypothetical protein
VRAHGGALVEARPRGAQAGAPGLVPWAAQDQAASRPVTGDHHDPDDWSGAIVALVIGALILGAMGWALWLVYR